MSLSAIAPWVPELGRIASLTLAQTLASTGLAVVVGLAWAWAEDRWAQARAGRACAQTGTASAVVSGTAGEWSGLLPFVLPTLAVAPLFLILSATTRDWPGLGALLAPGWPLVVIAHAALNAPWVRLGVRREWQTIAPPTREQLRSATASWAWEWRLLLWPVARLRVAVAASQIALLCWQSLLLVLWLGGGPPVESLETWVLLALRSSGEMAHPALVVAIGYQLAGGALLAWLAYRLEQRTRGPSAGAGAGAAQEIGVALAPLLPTARSPWRVRVSLLGVGAGLGFGGIVAAEAHRFDADVGVRVVWGVLTNVGASVGLSVGVAALSATVGIGALAALAAWWRMRRVARPIGSPSNTVMLRRGGADAPSIALTAVALGAVSPLIVLGLLRTLAVALGVWSEWESSVWLWSVGLSVLQVPFWLRSLAAMPRAGAVIREQVASLGARGRAIWWWAEGRAWSAPLAVLWGVSVAFGIGEWSAPTLLGGAQSSGDAVPLPLRVGQALGQYRFGAALSWAGIWVLAVASVLAAGLAAAAYAANGRLGQERRGRQAGSET